MTDLHHGPDLFDSRSARPMLIGKDVEAFDDPAWLFELKLDGVRSLAYLDASGTALVNRRGVRIDGKFPELAALHARVEGRCILDGELIVMRDGVPDFEAVMNRVLTKDGPRAGRDAARMPASFVAFDILYRDGEDWTARPLSARKDALAAVVAEDERLSVARYIQERGKDFFALAQARQLEGLIGKRAESLYRMGRRTAEWVKIKNLLDDDFVVCGYRTGKGASGSLVLGQYDRTGRLVYRGRVTIALSGGDFAAVHAVPKIPAPPFATPPPPDNEGAVWIRPVLVCTVQFMATGAAGGLRQPVYKGMRPDKSPQEAQEK